MEGIRPHSVLKDEAMSTTKVTSEVLKDLVTEYQKTSDPVVFSQILLRTDRLVYWTVHQMRRRFWYLRYENMNDLYQTGVVGVYKAALKIPDTEDPKKIPSWFVSYIRNEVLTSFSRPHPVHLSELEEVWAPAKEPDPLHENAAECLEVLFKRMLDAKIVSEEEVELIQLNKIRKLSLDTIAVEKGVCSDTVRSRISGALLRIQYKVRMLDLELEDCIPDLIA